MSKKTDERSTPQKLFDELDSEFKFDIDLAATKKNTKVERFYSLEDSAFKHEWNETSFLNPPYSDLYDWVYKAVNSKGLIVLVLPCDTSTKWFHDNLWDKSIHHERPNVKLRFPEGRYKFGKYRTSPKFATIIAVVGRK